MIISLLYPIANAIRALVQEKESKMKEGMMMMALRGDVHYLSWIVHFMCESLTLTLLLLLIIIFFLFLFFLIFSSPM